MIISTDTEKAFDKIEYLFMTKTVNGLVAENFLNLIKGIYEKPMTNMILSGKNLKLSF